MEASDEELMLAYSRGDARAFEELYGRHKGALYRFVLRSVKAAGEAEELAQEIWMRIIGARATYEPTAKFTTWLYSIAHNRLVDHWRRKELRIALAEAEDGPAAGSDADPALQAQANQVLARFAKALADLPHVQREAFLLHEEAGLSALEIAAVTLSEPEAVKSRLRYAFAKLKAATENG